MEEGLAWAGLLPTVPPLRTKWTSNLIKFGKSKQGLQHYQCKGCTPPSSPRAELSFIIGTPLKDILQTLALLGEGCA